MDEWIECVLAEARMRADLNEHQLEQLREVLEFYWTQGLIPERDRAA